MRFAVLVTGGKDSALALHRVLKQDHLVKYLVTMVPQREDSWMFHYPNIHMADLFAKAAGIPMVKGETSGVRDDEVEDLKRLLARLNIDAVASGAISSNYQKTRVDKVCRELGLKHVAPLWHEDSFNLLEEIISLRMETVIVGVYAHGFNATWLGRRIDEASVKDLVELNKRFEVSPVGEGGEYETLVLDAPFFKKRIELVEIEKRWQGQSGCLLVKQAVLVEKKGGKGERREVRF